MKLPFLDRSPRVALVRLHGVISARPGGFGPASLSLASLAPVLERAFALKRLSAVFLAINSPGGSAVQSALIAGRIRALAAEKRLPVIACVEDAAASGGYWLACAADEIVAEPTSILGSIGVIAAGFGFAEALEKLGVERRVRTAGTEKSFWDPFRPERQEDAERLHALLEDMHEEFRAWVRERRGAKLTAPEGELFTGRFWAGRRAVALGLADRLGADPVAEAKRRYGEKVQVIPVGARRPPIWRRLLPPGITAEGAIAALEERALWGRLGL
ncbi:MAG: S49 family peptidase [Acetobacteraceae bacterium]|nr:S49 family peptidase [Acetobacteraceae bacterium]